MTKWEKIMFGTKDVEIIKPILLFPGDLDISR